MFMNKFCYIWLMFCFSLLDFPRIHAENIGLCITATGKYIEFVSPLIESAEKYFCKDHKVTFYIFTDGKLEENEKIVRIEQKRLGWPYDTMMRYEIYLKNQKSFEEEDYLFALDADMLFVNKVGSEILGDLVATLHPGFIDKKGSYETREKSTACVCEGEGIHYFAGGFYGGKKNHVLKMFSTVLENIYKDLDQGIIAVWHDESHWNRYCIDNPPTVMLSPSYCYPENWSLPFKKRLLALDKNHQEYRK